MDLKGRRLLVIDPDPIARRGVVETLLSWGADVVEAATPAGADRIDRPVDAIVLSLATPYDAVADAVDRLRAHWPGVPVIAHSVLSAGGLEQRLPLGDVVVLSKPIRIPALREELSARLGD